MKARRVSLNVEVAVIAACGLGIIPGLVWAVIAGTLTSPRRVTA